MVKAIMRIFVLILLVISVSCSKSSSPQKAEESTPAQELSKQESLPLQPEVATGKEETQESKMAEEKAEISEGEKTKPESVVTKSGEEKKQMAMENPEIITIKDVQDVKPPVIFSHKKHNSSDGLNLKCVECHHNIKEGEQPKSCATCHDKEKDDGKKIALKGNPPTSVTKGMFHVKCVGCHKSEKDKNAASKAPTICNGCHKG